MVVTSADRTCEDNTPPTTVRTAIPFTAGREGYHTFRIPAVVVSARGTVLAFCEGRRNGPGDSGDIDTVLRRSFDGGETWEALQLVADHGPDTIGNPAPVVDRETGTISLLLTRNPGEDRQDAIEAGTSREARTVWLCRSEDDGASWSPPVEISATTRRPDWGWYATGPCNGIQLRGGRLVIPCHHAPRGSHVQQSHVLFSDDHGATWQLGGVVAPNTGESTVAELSDGALMLSIRSHPRLTGCRAVTISRDGGHTWSVPVRDETLVDPGCQGSLLSLGADRQHLLFSNPASDRREKLTVRLSTDDGRSWPVARELYAGPAGYSCLTALPDGSIGCLYERGVERSREEIAFAVFGMEWPSGG